MNELEHEMEHKYKTLKAERDKYRAALDYIFESEILDLTEEFETRREQIIKFKKGETENKKTAREHFLFACFAIGQYKNAAYIAIKDFPVDNDKTTRT